MYQYFAQMLNVENKSFHLLLFPWIKDKSRVTKKNKVVFLALA